MLLRVPGPGECPQLVRSLRPRTAMFPSTQLSLVLSLNLAAGAWARAVPAQQHQLAAGGGEVADRCAALVPCVECALGFSSCGQCPPAQVVSGLDAFSYQVHQVQVQSSSLALARL